MYTTFDQVVLVRRDRKTTITTDPVIYVREYRGERILTSDPSPSRYATEALRYGVFYEDAQGQVCVVPDQWSDDDALAALSFQGSLDSWEE